MLYGVKLKKTNVTGLKGKAARNVIIMCYRSVNIIFVVKFDKLQLIP